MKHKILILLVIFPLYIFTFAQVNYDNEYENDSFTLNQTLEPSKSYHYKATGSIDLNSGFRYEPVNGNVSLFVSDPMMLFPPTYGTTFSNAFDPNGISYHAPEGLPYSLPMITDVNNNGAAVIKVPIDCPPGVNGLNPDLSFIYNSQAGDGIMGPGWSIGGMSKISRVPYKYYYSEYSNAVTFTTQDDFSLDGNRLLKGADNNYYPEVFDNSVIRYNQTNKSFTVEKPNGFVYTYGGTNDSKNYVINNLSEPIEWHLSSIKDPYGNMINFSYSKDQ